MVLAAMSAAQQSSQPSAHEHMQHEHAGMVMNMPAAPVAQSASGTSWIPASSPLHMWMSTLGGWQLMAHGELFVGYNQQGGPLGVGKVESQNWLMLMQERKLGAATLQVRQMLSAEPLTAPHPGYPELFQTPIREQGPGLFPTLRSGPWPSERKARCWNRRSANAFWSDPTHAAAHRTSPS